MPQLRRAAEGLGAPAAELRAAMRAPRGGVAEDGAAKRAEVAVGRIVALVLQVGQEWAEVSSPPIYRRLVGRLLSSALAAPVAAVLSLPRLSALEARQLHHLFMPCAELRLS